MTSRSSSASFHSELFSPFLQMDSLELMLTIPRRLIAQVNPLGIRDEITSEGMYDSFRYPAGSPLELTSSRSITQRLSRSYASECLVILIWIGSPFLVWRSIKASSKDSSGVSLEARSPKTLIFCCARYGAADRGSKTAIADLSSPLPTLRV